MRRGLTKSTLIRLRELSDQSEDRQLTTAAVAEHLRVQLRTARRILKRLERAGAAEPVGVEHSGRSGRPPVVYRTGFDGGNRRRGRWCWMGRGVVASTTRARNRPTAQPWRAACPYRSRRPSVWWPRLPRWAPG